MLKFNDYLKEAALSAKQKKIAAIAGDKDKIDADDLAALRAGKKPVDECDYGKMKKEELIGNQKKLDKNHNGKLDADDFKKLRKEEAELDEATKHEASHMTTADHVYANSDSPGHEDRKAYKEHMKNHFNVTTKWHDSGDTVEHHGSHKDITAAKKHIDYLDKHGSVSGFSGHETHNVNESVEQIDEGKMKELSMDLKDMSHDEFHKQYGKPKSHFDPTNFKKPVEPGKGMDRAKALAQRGIQSLSKEEVERIEEKLTQIDELSKAALTSYANKASDSYADHKAKEKKAMSNYEKTASGEKSPSYDKHGRDEYEQGEHHADKAAKRKAGVFVCGSYIVTNIHIASCVSELYIARIAFDDSVLNLLMALFLVLNLLSNILVQYTAC